MEALKSSKLDSKGLVVFDKYVPIIVWIIVQLLLILSMVLNLATQQFDYTNVFCQAPLENIVVVELPAGFEVPKKVLLLQNLVMD